MSITFYRTDRWGNQLGTLQNVSSAQRDRTTTGTDTVDIESTTQCAKGDRIVFKDATGTVREYIVSDLEQAQTDYLMFTYHLVNSVTELSLYFIEDRRVRGGNALTAITRALEGTRWSVGDVEASSELDISFYHQSAYDSLLDICNDYGLEYETVIELNSTGDAIISRTINLTSHIGSTTVRRFDFGRNLSGLTRTIDSSDVITRLYPYGNGVATEDEEGEETGGYSRKITIEDVNDGIPYIEDEEATQLWGVPGPDGEILPAMGTEDFDTDDPQELLEMAQAALPSLTEPTITYEATVAVLGIESQSRLAVGVGDDVVVVDTAYPSPIRLSGRVLEIQDDLLDPLGDGTTITLGNLDESFTSSMNTVSSQVSSMVSSSSAWDDAATASGSYVDAVVNVMNEILNQTGGYVYFTKNEGIFVYDRPVDEDPTMVIQIGGGYFRIADSKDSNGDWEWRTMGTGAGLIADVIVAGIIRGTRSYWDLDNGVFSMQNSDGVDTVYFDGSVGNNILSGSLRTKPEGSSEPYTYIPTLWASFTAEDSYLGSGIVFRDDDGDSAAFPQIGSLNVSDTYGEVEGIYMNTGYYAANYPGASLAMLAEPNTVGATGRSNWRSYGQLVASTDFLRSQTGSTSSVSVGMVVVRGTGGSGAEATLATQSSSGTVNTWVQSENTGGAAYTHIRAQGTSTGSSIYIYAGGMTGTRVECTAARASGSVETGFIASTASNAPYLYLGGYLGGISSNVTMNFLPQGSDFTVSANGSFTLSCSFTANAYGTFRYMATARGSGYVTCNVNSQTSSSCEVHMINTSSSSRTIGANVLAIACSGDL